MYIDWAQAKIKNRWPMKIKEYKITPEYSWALIEINWDHGKIKCLKEDRIYYIVKWSWIFTINNKEHLVSNEDVLFVPKNTTYNFSWNMKLFIICSPEFNPNDDISIR